MTDKPRKRRISDIYQFSTSKFCYQKNFVTFFCKNSFILQKNFGIPWHCNFQREKQKAFWHFWLKYDINRIDLSIDILNIINFYTLQFWIVESSF